MRPNEQTSVWKFLGRVFWMIVGPMLLVLLAFVIVGTGNGWLTGADVAYLGLLGAVMLVRWLEYRGGGSTTSTGELATPTHLRRYFAGAAVIGLAAWVAANIVGNYVLAS